METQLHRLTFPLPEGLGPFSETRSLEELKVDSYNKTPGNLTGYDCPKCRNRGTHAVLREEKEICIEDCECMRIRRFVRAAEKSGLRNMLEEKRFQKFEDKEPWQKEMKRSWQPITRI